MKKKWIISTIAVGIVSAGAYVYKKLTHKTESAKDFERTNIIELFEQDGYVVHNYNNHHDLLAFHPKKNEKMHVFYDDGEEEVGAFFDKTKAYFQHFTSTIYIISKNEEVLSSHTLPKLHQFLKENDSIKVCTFYYSLYEDFISDKDEIWMELRK